MGWAEEWNAVGARILQLETGVCGMGVQPTESKPFVEYRGTAVVRIQRHFNADWIHLRRWRVSA
jgi:hypothetical protein